METLSSTLINPCFILPTARGIEFIDINNIIRIEAIGSYSKLFFKDGKSLVVAKVLKWIMERLPVSQFIRIHSKHVVNKQLVCQFIHGEGSQVKLSNGEFLNVSRRKKTFVLQSLHRNAA